MAKSLLEQIGISEEAVGLVLQLVDGIPHPEQRIAMAEVALTLLGGVHRQAETVFGREKSEWKNRLDWSESLWFSAIAQIQPFLIAKQVDVNRYYR